MLQNALDLSVGAVRADDTVPVWAQEAVSALGSHGICLDAGRILTRGEAALAIYRTNQLKADAPGMMPLRRAQ